MKTWTSAGFMSTTTKVVCRDINFLRVYPKRYRYTNTSLSISSNPHSLCFCENGALNYSINSKELIVPPGQTFNISVIGIGVLKIPVPSRAVHSFESIEDIDLLRKHYNTGKYNGSCYDIGFVFYTTIAKRFNFQIYPYENKKCSRKIKIYVSIGNCPPGFELITNNCTCETKLSRVLEDSRSCDIDTGLIRRPRYYWLKPIRNGSIYIGYMFSKNCPGSYCKDENDSDPTWLNFSKLLSADVDQQCNAHHTGILCGVCKQGYSITLGDLNCSFCKSRYISLILVFMAAGIMVVVVSLLLRMNISAGTLNGLIFYANLVNISRDLFFPPQEVKVNLFTVFISWMNLDFGIPVCFYNGLNA